MLLLGQGAPVFVSMGWSGFFLFFCLSAYIMRLECTSALYAWTVCCTVREETTAFSLIVTICPILTHRLSVLDTGIGAEGRLYQTQTNRGWIERHHHQNFGELAPPLMMS